MHYMNSTSIVLTDGYDLPVYGLARGQFLAIHIPALTCIFLSLLSALAVLIFSFRYKTFRTFFKWSKSERFVVYLALCDGLFNISHSLDHMHIVITRNHVYPRHLCEFYGFMLAEFITAQNLMVNIVSINAFVLIYFRRNLNFGKYDYKLLLWMFGAPCLAAFVALTMGTLGPNGSFCYFDGVKGELANLFFTTVPLTVILFINTILYVLTWLRIRKEEPRFKDLRGKEAKTIRASHRAARTMSLFVSAFILQWWAMATYGIVQISVSEVPIELFQFVTTFSNIGGMLNGVVYVIIRRRTKEKHSSDDGLEMSRSNNSSTAGFRKMRTADVSPVQQAKSTGTIETQL